MTIKKYFKLTERDRSFLKMLVQREKIRKTNEVFDYRTNCPDKEKKELDDYFKYLDELNNKL